jgi:hypothetical protein
MRAALGWKLLAPAIVYATIAGCASQPSEPDDSSAVIATAERVDLRTAEIDERFRPSLEALQGATMSGQDVEARAILERTKLLGPEGPTLELLNAFEKILDGRAAVQLLDLTLESDYLRDPGGAGVASVSLVASTRAASEILARPGPATLRVSLQSFDAKGSESTSNESLPLGDLSAISVRPGTSARMQIARFPVGLHKNGFALRVTCELELCAGAVVVNERDLPAMRWRVATGEIVLLSTELALKGLSTPADLVREVENGTCARRAALEIAVRLPRSEREPALDRLGQMTNRLSQPAIESLTPALRWLAPDADLGEDAARWRAFLRQRGEHVERGDELKLPRRNTLTASGS